MEDHGKEPRGSASLYSTLESPALRSARAGQKDRRATERRTYALGDRRWAIPRRDADRARSIKLDGLDAGPGPHAPGESEERRLALSLAVDYHKTALQCGVRLVDVATQDEEGATDTAKRFLDFLQGRE